jgi:hypothetical protein
MVLLSEREDNFIARVGGLPMDHETKKANQSWIHTTELGVKTNPADPPTTTLISTPRVAGARARETRVAQSAILSLNIIVVCRSRSTAFRVENIALLVGLAQQADGSERAR